MSQLVMKGRIGPGTGSDSGEDSIRLGRTLEQMVSDTHGRFYEANSRGTLFSGGMAITSISNATFTSLSVSVSNTITSIAGVWNPNTSSVNLVILQAALAVSQTALQATGPGGFVWAMSTGNTAITAGAAPLNRKTLAASGSQAKDLTNTAPTGLTNNLVAKFGSSLGGGSAIGAAFLATQVAAQTVQAPGNVENIDGSIIVPPGGVLALLATITPVGHSAASSLLWEEVPV